ncbi:MAG: ATP-binding protein [Fidelibacterota bacterium]|nr:MAG: ATP-binding protein [Candidatus Neomarinimicrobiota bacterium]
MVFKHFQINVTLRVLFLSATLVVTVYLFVNTTILAISLLLTGVALVQVYALVRYVTRTNRDLARFLQSLRYADFSQSFTDDGRGGSYRELRNALNDIIMTFQQERLEKEADYRYLETIVERVSTALISYDQTGKVSLMNRAARRLLQLPGLSNIRGLDDISPLLTQTMQRIKPGQRELVKVEISNEPMQLALSATEVRTHGQAFAMVSIHNIHSELERQELDAWQNLIRVLTHEIMNSVTPIASLASTLHSLLPPATQRKKGKGREEVDAGDLGDIRSGIQTIQQRSQGLLHFVESYRNLTRIPQPDFQVFPISEFFMRIDRLMAEELAAKSIEWKTSIDPTHLELTADMGLIEQVLINLLLNAVQAIDGRPTPRIHLRSRLNETGRVLIEVEDNGPGIIEEVQQKIFIPFYSTRKQGSGIGLALCREIMRLHGGSIGVRSVPDVNTVFTLRF